MAVKTIDTDWLDRRRLAFLKAEIEIHREVSSHPYVVRLLGVYDDPEAFCLVEELAQGRSLLDHLHSRESMETEKEVCAILYQRAFMAALVGGGLVLPGCRVSSAEFSWKFIGISKKIFVL